MPSSSQAFLVSGRLLLRSLGTIGLRDITETNGREMPSQKRTAQFFCATRQTLVVNEMFETAAEYKFDTVSDAAKDIVKILPPFCSNNDGLLMDLRLYIPTMEINCFETFKLNCAILIGIQWA